LYGAGQEDRAVATPVRVDQLGCNIGREGLAHDLRSVIVAGACLDVRLHELSQVHRGRRLAERRYKPSGPVSEQREVASGSGRSVTKHPDGALGSLSRAVRTVERVGDEDGRGADRERVAM